ncbi:tRNA guanosine(34) transglycosylase Tgt [Candidatus Gottesmanbacteria bacterium]|nr:tRNA guanosine(34) transglycosylase Tgt [Candidatus Gottesmanbacteria bacterium]
MVDFGFRVQAKDKKTKARVGEIMTPHGIIQTPAFVPVGTQGAVKSLTPEEIRECGTQLFFVNTYHTYLRPGLDVIKKFGGLHQFMGWDGPIITDSGGFQVFSLGRRGKGAEVADENLDPSSVSGSRFHGLDTKKKMKPDKILSAPRAIASLVKISDEGAEFRSHWDGTKHFFTPEKAMEYQWVLGSDIHIAFDDCTPYGLTHEKARISMDRTHRWAARSLSANAKIKMQNAKLGKPYQALYGSVQGSIYEDLRKESAKFISTLDFDGIAIGGVSVGETKKEMVDVLDWVVPLLPVEKPRHLLGVGEIDDIFALVARGMDTFDCVQPTRLARVGCVYINAASRKWEMDITKKACAEDIRPIEEGCECYACQHFSRAYIHHLFRVKELLAYRLATIHNIHFINSLMEDIRRAIEDGSLLDLTKQWL